MLFIIPLHCVFAFKFVLEVKFVRMLFAFEFVLEDKFVRMLFAFEFVLEDKFVRMLLVPLERRMFSALSFRPSVHPSIRPSVRPSVKKTNLGAIFELFSFPCRDDQYYYRL